MKCPECNNTELNNWNVLHTHLWRVHQIDMELYSCDQCNFKTPIFSRLVNTHAKIHSDERNYNCDKCEKKFKNSKQLKNHRRWHRQNEASKEAEKQGIKKCELHQCEHCNAAFSHKKSLKEHICQKHADILGVMQPSKKVEILQCVKCGKECSSKSSLKLHMFTHEPSKRFQCEKCNYTSNDHNAFRRHKMTHEDNAKNYNCPYCSYKSIQSVAFQKHIRHKHSEKADDVIFQCEDCNFSTINSALLLVHKAKHATKSNANAHIADNNTLQVQDSSNKPSTSIIKVKSNLQLTEPSYVAHASSNLCIETDVLVT